MRYRNIALGVILASILYLGSGHASADTLGAMQDYQVPGGSNLYGITERQDGSIWFTQESSSSPKIWKFDRLNYNPSNPNAAFTSYTVSAMPHHIVSGPNNSVYALTGSTITKVDSSGTVTAFTMPIIYSGGFSYPWNAMSVAFGPDGNIWVLAQNGAVSSTASTMMKFSPSGTLLNTYSATMPGSEVIYSSADYVNNRIWVLTRSYSYPAGYSSRLGYYDMGGNLTYSTLGISSALGGTMTSAGKYWVVGDSNKLQSMDASGSLSSVYTLPYSSAGIWRVAQGPDGYLWATLSNIDKIVRVDQSGNMSNATVYGYVPGGNGSMSARPIGITAASDGNMWFTQYNNGRITKIGTGTTASGIDTDNDGLSRADEAAQGTSDFVRDTDADGLSDYVESSSYPNRNAVFCDVAVTTCAYPNPLQKNIYVEADWMNRSGTSFQMTSTQAASVVQAYTNKGLLLTIDYGQLGGANEVPYTQNLYFYPHTNQTDFYDIKNGTSTTSAQFNSQRKGIYRYMILGDRWVNEDNGNNTTTTGASFPADDDIFVAYGLLLDNPSSYSDFDTAISGTSLHELGHSVCLTSGSSTFTGCSSASIDSHAGVSYLSVMNYDYQLSTVDYSSGGGGAGDHDDWSAIINNVNAFALDGDSDDGLAHGKRLMKAKTIVHANSKPVK